MLVDNLTEIKLKITQYGIKIEDGASIPGFDGFEFRAPFGNGTEMITRSLQSEDRL